jgi:hypothetical protein
MSERSEERRYCHNCGSELPNAAANFCPACGAAQDPSVTVPRDVPQPPEPGRIQTPPVPGVPQPVNVTVTQSQRQYGCGTGCGVGCLAIVVGMVILAMTGAFLEALSGESGPGAQVGAWATLVILPLVAAGVGWAVAENRSPGVTRRTIDRLRGEPHDSPRPGTPPSNPANYGTGGQWMPHPDDEERRE